MNPEREPLLVRYTDTESGNPLTEKEARKHFKRAVPAAPGGWFWAFATPTSAARIRRDGHKAVGTLTTTWIPPQTGDFRVDPGAVEPDGPFLPMYAPDDPTGPPVGLAFAGVRDFAEANRDATLGSNE